MKGLKADKGRDVAKLVFDRLLVQLKILLKRQVAFLELSNGPIEPLV